MSDLATAGRLRPCHDAVSRFLVLRSPRPRGRAAACCSRARPGYVGHELMVPDAGDFQVARRARQRADARPQRGRASSCCPTSAATARRSCSMAAATRATSCARCTAGPTTSRASSSARRISPTSPASTSPARRCRTGTACCSTASATCARDLAGAGRQALRLLGLRARPRRDARCATTTGRSFIEVYLEDYHVGPVPSRPRPVRHLRRPQLGVRRLVLGADRGHQQQLAKPGSRTYERWHKAVLDFYRGELPQHGAVWLTYYPNVMLEWYPHVLVISTLIPRGAWTARATSSSSTIPRRSRCSSASSSRPSRRPTWKRRGRTTRSPSAWTRAGAALYAPGRSEIGPYQSPMEDGMQHFHEFYRREMEAHIAHL